MALMIKNEDCGGKSEQCSSYTEKTKKKNKTRLLKTFTHTPSVSDWGKLIGDASTELWDACL